MFELSWVHSTFTVYLESQQLFVSSLEQQESTNSRKSVACAAQSPSAILHIRMLSGEEVDSMPVGELTDVKELKLHLVLLLHTIARSQAPHPRESRLPFIFFGWVRVATFGFCRKGPTTGALDYCVLTQLRSMLL